MVGKAKHLDARLAARAFAVGCALFALVLACAVAVCLAPRAALADAGDYRVVLSEFKVKAEADGSLFVREARTYQFMAEARTVEWSIPRDTASGVDVEVEPVYSFSDIAPEQPDEARFLTVVATAKGEAGSTETILLHYHVKGAVARWADCAELNWRYADSVPEGDFWGTTCVIETLPEGATPADGVIEAWVHQPLPDGNVKVEASTVTVQAPRAGGCPVEVRAVLPADAFAELAARDQAKAAEITTQEEARAAEQDQPHVSDYAAGVDTSPDGNATSDAVSSQVAPFLAVVVIGWGVVVALVAFMVVRTVRYRRMHRASFDEKYWQDAPAPLHPAILDYIWDGESGGGEALAASLMRLDRLGALRLEVADVVHDNPEWVMESRNVKVGVVPGSASALDDPLDRAAARFVQAVSRACASDGNSESGENPPLMSLRKFADASSSVGASFQAALDAWNHEVEVAVSQHGVNTDTGPGRKSGGAGLLPSETQEAQWLRSIDSTKAKVKRFFKSTLGWDVIGIALGLLTVYAGSFAAGWDFIFGSAMMSRGLTVPFLLLPFALVACGFAVPRVLKSQWGLSKEAVEIRARMSALGKWLRKKPGDWSRVPTDAPTWNAIMESAIVMGMPDKAAKAMTECVFRVDEEDDLKAACRWCLPPNPSSDSIAKKFEAAYAEMKKNLDRQES